ncbi:hypothetical protein RL72_03291 [Microbacterium azadirachtae]|uniref:SnoaL-like domain-containing protein n=1 Tax=Microbacterium azadirachtae TaxID=582680 RepID=A0A0F0KD40_9MICO|nr:nuclear transport factor 2 family protein [Microbacterium azadirachtae]KJL18822.1 hypothetical protein RL72_03291 [Microbacterium azadirachtae]
MEADADAADAIRALIARTYAAMSTPGSDFAEIFGHPDMTVAGSGAGELMDGPERVIAVAGAIAAQGRVWVPERVRVWRRGDVAWAQILGGVDLTESGGVVRVPYTTTRVFSLGADGWRWVYWGGAEPQESPRV